MEYINLLGSEDVKRAGTTIQNAAVDMQRAAFSIEDSLSRHRLFLNELILRFETALSRQQVSPNKNG